MNFYERLAVRYPALGRLPMHHIKRHAEHLKRHWLTVSFFFGFVVDSLTLNRVDRIFDNIVLGWYIILTMISLLLLYAAAAGKIWEKYEWYAKEWLPMVIQYALGGLLSGMLIFYSRSGSWWASWPFLLVIIVVMVGNERLTRRAQRLLLNLTMLFIGLFSYIVLIVPVVLAKMGPWIFVFSGLLALLLMFGFVRLLMLVVPNFMRANIRMIAFTLGLTFITLNILYFTNVIPPIPLSIKELGIYHNVERLESGNYALTYEQGGWYQFFKDSDTTFHFQIGDTIYCFASVFAPSSLSTEIFHRWEYYVVGDSEWRTHSRTSYRIDGGRGDGFRGYTWIRQPTPGRWRCTVETERKQVLGSETFTVVHESVPRGLVTELR